MSIKRILIMLVTAGALVSLTACGGSNEDSGAIAPGPTSTTPAVDVEKQRCVIVVELLADGEVGSTAKEEIVQFLAAKKYARCLGEALMSTGEDDTLAFEILGAIAAVGSEKELVYLDRFEQSREVMPSELGAMLGIARDRLSKSKPAE